MNLKVFIIILRESFEALLIIGILIAVANKRSVGRAQMLVFSGAIFGLFCSLILGYLILNSSVWVPESIFNSFDIVLPLVAAILIFHLIFVMSKLTQDRIESMKNELDQKLSLGQNNTLFVISFVSVLREGIETVLFLSGELSHPELKKTELIVSFVTALTAAFIIYKLIIKLSHKIGMKLFFKLSSAALLFLAIQMLLKSYRQAESAGWF